MGVGNIFLGGIVVGFFWEVWGFLLIGERELVEGIFGKKFCWKFYEVLCWGLFYGFYFIGFSVYGLFFR